MPMLGSGDGHSIHVLQLEYLPEVLVSYRGIAQLKLGIGGEFLQNIAVHVADMRDAGRVLVGLERGKVSIGP